MKLHSLLFIFILCGFRIFSAEPPALNLDFSQRGEDGQFKYWLRRGTDAEYVAENGLLTIKPIVSDGVKFLIQSPIEMQSGPKYRLSYEYRGDNGMKSAVYIEFRNANNKLTGINASLSPVGDDWKLFSVDFNMPDVFSGPYIVVMIGAGNGSCQFRNIRLDNLEHANDTAQQHSLKTPIVSSKYISLENWYGANHEKQPNGNIHLVINDKITASSKVKLRNGEFYRFGFDGATRKSNELTGFASFQFCVKKGDNIVFASEWDDIMNNAGSSKEFTFQANDDGQYTFEITSHGEIVIKDMRLEIINPSEASPVVMHLSYPAYRNTILDSRRNEIAGNIELKDNSMYVEMTLTDKASPKQPLISLICKDGDFRLPGSSELPIGEYLLTVVPLGEKHNKLQQFETDIHIIKEPKECYRYEPSENTFYLNDSPIHFHGIMHGYYSELAWLYRYYGVTTFVVIAGTPEQLLHELDKAHKLGLRLLLSTRADYYKKEKKDFFDEWKRYMNFMLTPKVLEHPALAGYISADEPAWCDFPFNALESITKFIHEKDSTRPIWINEAPRGSVEINSRIASAADAFGVDIYPIPYPNGHSGLEDKNITAVGAYTRRCRQAAGPMKPIWMVLQGFAWNDLHHEPGAVYPTAAESRFMALEAMANGANADIYYGVNSIKNADFYLEMLKTISEVAMLSKLWQAGNTINISAADGIKTFAGIVDGEKYIVAINTTPMELDSHINLIGLYELPAGKPAANQRFDKYTARVFASVPHYPGDFNNRPNYDKVEEEKAITFLKKIFASTEPYNGKAQWIWYPGDAKAIICSSTLALDFSLKEQAVKARLLVAADDYGFVTLNGKQVGKGGGWKTMENYHVHSLLTPGKNRIEVQVASEGAPPSGLLLDLSVEYADGSTQTFLSGPEWQAIKPGEPVKNAEVIAPYGGGAWGTKVEFYQQPSN